MRWIQLVAEGRRSHTDSRTETRDQTCCGEFKNVRITAWSSVNSFSRHRNRYSQWGHELSWGSCVSISIRNPSCVMVFVICQSEGVLCKIIDVTGLSSLSKWYLLFSFFSAAHSCHFCPSRFAFIVLLFLTFLTNFPFLYSCHPPSSYDFSLPLLKPEHFAIILYYLILQGDSALKNLQAKQINNKKGHFHV